MRITVLRNRGSQSARALANALSKYFTNNPVCLIRAGGRALSCRDDRYVMNWGVAQEPHLQQRRLVVSNTYESVAACQNKLSTFMALAHRQVAHVGWSPVRNAVVDNWLEEDRKIVVRNTVTGHSGAGIQIVRVGQAIPPAPLYTRYFRKNAEYRVHVAFGNVISIQQKRRNNHTDATEAYESGLVRTVANGWVFSVQNLSCDARNYRQDIEMLALSAAAAVGAQHCAVDILSNHQSERNVVVEINSAPGITAPSTAAAYKAAFIAHIESQWR